MWYVIFDFWKIYRNDKIISSFVQWNEMKWSEESEDERRLKAGDKSSHHDDELNEIDANWIKQLPTGYWKDS